MENESEVNVVVYKRILELESMLKRITVAYDKALQDEDFLMMRELATAKRDVNELILVNKSIYYDTGVVQ
jgi:hypothetical protein